MKLPVWQAQRLAAALRAVDGHDEVAEKTGGGGKSSAFKLYEFPMKVRMRLMMAGNALDPIIRAHTRTMNQLRQRIIYFGEDSADRRNGPISEHLSPQQTELEIDRRNTILNLAIGAEQDEEVEVAIRRIDVKEFALDKNPLPTSVLQGLHPMLKGLDEFEGGDE